MMLLFLEKSCFRRTPFKLQSITAGWSSSAYWVIVADFWSTYRRLYLFFFEFWDKTWFMQ